MDYDIELFFREYWRDPRLVFDRQLFDNATQINLHESIVENIWIPDTYFPNAIKSRNPNRKSTTHRSFARVDPDGHVLHSRRLSLKAECPMNLQAFPFDRQVCVLSIESYGYDVSDVVYVWRKNDPVVLDPYLELPEFKIRHVIIKEHNVTLATGVYTRLECCFFFKRSYGFFFIQLFLPSTAMVITSWLLIFMERTSKFSDMIEVILAVTLLYYSYISVMPRVSYIKAMDIYLGACFLFVFASLVKLYALKLHRRRRRYADAHTNTENVAVSRNNNGGRYSYEENEEEPDEEEKEFDEDIRENEERKRSLTKTDEASTDTSVMWYEPHVSPNNVGQCKVTPNAHKPKINFMSTCRSRCRYLLSSKVTTLGIFPFTFCVFSVAFFVYYLLIADDDGGEKCTFPHAQK